MIHGLLAAGCLPLLSPATAADPSPEPRIVGPIDAPHRDRLLRFRVPEGARKSAESPVRLVAEVVRAESRPPYVLEAYLLVPVARGEAAATEPVGPGGYRRVPFGRMDVFAPLPAGRAFELFPAEAADAARRHVRAGEEVLVGIDALPAWPEAAAPLVTVKVRELVAW